MEVGPGLCAQGLAKFRSTAQRSQSDMTVSVLLGFLEI